MSRGPSGEAERPVNFPREWREIACTHPMVGRCGRSWQAWRPSRAVGFVASITTIKLKGSPPGFHTFHPCLRIHDCRHQLLRFPVSASPPPSSSHPPTPISNGSMVPLSYHLPTHGGPRSSWSSLCTDHGRGVATAQRGGSAITAQWLCGVVHPLP